MKTLTLSFNPRHYQGCRNTVTNQAAGDRCSEALQEHGKKGLRDVWMGGEKTPPRRFFEGNGDICFSVHKCRKKTTTAERTECNSSKNCQNY